MQARRRTVAVGLDVRAQMDGADSLPVFAYGTLKQGFHNHAAYCRGARDLIPAETWGRLYIWQPGIPILQVPDDRILLSGTRHLAGDLEAAKRMTPDAKHQAKSPGRGWRRIQGEVIVFPDAEPRMKLLDAFEGVHPAPSARTYDRVLLPVRLRESRKGLPEWMAAWCYILPPFADEPDERVDTDCWQPGMGA